MISFLYISSLSYLFGWLKFTFRGQMCKEWYMIIYMGHVVIFSNIEGLKWNLSSI